jgi:hypothetical protein
MVQAVGQKGLIGNTYIHEPTIDVGPVIVTPKSTLDAGSPGSLVLLEDINMQEAAVTVVVSTDTQRRSDLL